MLIKYIKIVLINTLLFLNFSVKADTQNYIVGNNKEKINQRIGNFFISHPNEKRVFWVPEIKGKSRYAFSIQKDAYLTSTKYADASDLYYLSEKIDEGLKFEHNESKQVEISILKNNFNATYKQGHLLGISSGIFFEKKDNSFGIILNKDFIISKNSLANFGFKQAQDKYIVFDAKFLKLFDNENSEFYGILNHELKSDILNVGIGHTWFEIANQYDLTLGIQEHDKKLEAELYATFGDERMKFEIGLDQIKNVSQSNMFFNLKFENILDIENFRTNIIVTSKDSILGLRNISLKSFRKKNLDMLWKKHMSYN
jgi:hypothetical protein